MSDEEFYLLNELIETHFGLSFPDHKREILAGRLRPRLVALHLTSFREYYLRLHGNLANELSTLATLVTNNETYLFREVGHFEALLEQGIDLLRTALAVPGALRMLCAGCSSGEEAYTASFYLRDAGGNPGGLRPQIDAFDIDVTRLEIARRASFRARSVRGMTEDRIHRYLERTDEDEFRVRPAYQLGVSFSPGNIMELASFRRGLPYDVLFCRNVLIYFSPGALRKAIDNFAEVLRPGGLLFLGHSESIIGMSERFETVRCGRSLVYRRVEP